MIKLAPAPEIPAACLIAARRAVYAELAVLVSNLSDAGWGAGSVSPEDYRGLGPIVIQGGTGVDIGPIIDVAVREAIVVHSNLDPQPKRRRWWQVWRRA